MFFWFLISLVSIFIGVVPFTLANLRSEKSPQPTISANATIKSVPTGGVLSISFAFCLSLTTTRSFEIVATGMFRKNRSNSSAERCVIFDASSAKLGISLKSVPSCNILATLFLPCSVFRSNVEYLAINSINFGEKFVLLL